MPILINNLQQKEPFTKSQFELIETIVKYGLGYYQKETAEVSIIFADDDYLRNLNFEYRGLNQPTDVLSFAIGEEQPGTPVVNGESAVGLPELLGDIFISVERAVEQAKSYHHSLEREICYLTIHGLLHLLGFDHRTTEETTKMRQAEEQILANFDIKRV
jgi:probable rRNA maturation factor